MSAADHSGPDDLRQGALVPAALIAAIGIGVILLRPPLPIDETRYLEVFRESLRGSALLLRLSGEPYAEKPPLLFWLGRALTLLGISSWAALRLVPALASALTVLFAARVGRRAGLAHVGWLQAALLVPTMAGEFLLFDPLLAACIWGALDAWTRRKDVGVWAWSSAALLAKGPVALLFLIPFLWSTAPLRDGPRATGRAALILVLALVPLAAWALSAAALGGPEFAEALLWKRWAGRLVSQPGPSTSTGPTNHPRSLFFYLPVAALGALPVTHILFLRARGPRPTWNRRLAISLIFLLIAFTAISGKQAHYLVPMGPAVALLAAWWLAGGATRELAWLRHGVRVQLALVLAAIVLAAVMIPRALDAFCPLGVAWLESGQWKLVLATAALLPMLGFALAGRLRSVPALCASAVALTGVSLLPVHALAGRLLFPHVLAAALTLPPGTEIVSFGGAMHGVYELLADADGLTKILERDALVPWLAQHPGALLLSETNSFQGEIPAELETLAKDVVHGTEVLLLRAKP